MAEKKLAPIIIKKKKGAHGGAHGGAWKVAYADFVTAMMCFFMVMWLMGSDEETKAAVASYFTNPSSAYRIDMSSKDVLPLGDKTGAGDSILKGADGQVPEDMVERPSRPILEGNTQAETPMDAVNRVVSSGDKVFIEAMRFSVLEEDLFDPGTKEVKWAKEAPGIFKKISEISKSYPDSTLKIQAQLTPKEDYEFKNQKLVEISKYLTQQKLMTPNRVSTQIEKTTIPSGRLDFWFEKTR